MERELFIDSVEEKNKKQKCNKTGEIITSVIFKVKGSDNDGLISFTLDIPECEFEDDIYSVDKILTLISENDSGEDVETENEPNTEDWDEEEDEDE